MISKVCFNREELGKIVIDLQDVQGLWIVVEFGKASLLRILTLRVFRMMGGHCFVDF